MAGMASAVLLVLAPNAKAEQWRLASKMATNSTEGRGFQLFADLVKKYTDGKLTIRIYPTEQLGKVDATLEQLSAGTIQIYTEGPDYLHKWAPELEWVFAPFMFADREHWVRFMDSDLVKGWLDRVEEKAGITVIRTITGFPRGPYRVLSTKRPVKTMADLKGLKLRMFKNQVAVDAWTALGAEIRVLAWTDVYTSIKSGLVESVTEPISITEDMKFYEVAPHIVRTDEFSQSVAFMVNAKAYNGLAPDIRAAVDRAHLEASQNQQKVFDEMVSASIDRMKAKGATYIEPDTTEWVSTVQALYNKMDAEGKLPKGLLAAVAATRKK
jgi:tripartite ATP-independent transporter DctP family solute receptor